MNAITTCKAQSPFPVWLLAPCVFASAAFTHGKLQCEERSTYKQNGEWRQDYARSESLSPFLLGLGVPRFACWMVNAIVTDLVISCEGTQLKVIDKTLFGTNATEVILGGEEVECTAKGGRKKYMLSGFKDAEGRLTVQCRMFMRGEGWFTRQIWAVTADGVLEEKMVLQRPGEDDIVVTRFFRPLLGESDDKSKPLCSMTDAGVQSESTSHTNRIGMASAALVVGGAALGVLGICAAVRAKDETR